MDETLLEREKRLTKKKDETNEKIENNDLD
jgi:hypothetical protein